MADAPELRRSLWRELFWKPTFRSRRERVGHSIYGGVIAFLVIFPAAYFEWFDSLLSLFLWIVLVITGLQWGGWLVWLAWGRKRFPLPAADEPQSTA